jgi:TolB-like protein/class 3 adenylate cyclase/Tfp pilus assembly protein PilF
MPEDRRLAAIMFTDIVGYTALMGSDEDKAFDMLKRNHTIHATLIEKHNGVLIKEVGDGTLASFSLGSDAVRCAIEIQKEAKSQNISLKIGIHEGEMVMAGEDVLGDGVNIASRLQEISADGSISISGRVYSDVKNKAGVQTKFIGDKRLKNVEDPVKVYKVLWEEEKEKPVEGEETKSKIKPLYYIMAGIVVVLVLVIVWQFLPSKETSPPIPEVVDKSIAVLPFRNDSPEEANEYFCNGTVEAILTNIQKIEDLKVKSRTSAELYRNPDKDLTVIAKELNVAFILEGSVQKIDDNIRITAQLIDGRTNDHLWAENYDGKYTEEVLEFQSDVAKKIASSLQAVITPKEEEQIDYRSTDNMEAYDLEMRGHEMLKKFRYTRDTTFATIAINLLNQAFELDPENEVASRLIGSVYLEKGSYDTAMYYFERTIALFPDFWGGYQGKGRIFMLNNQLDSAYIYVSKGYNKNPNDPWTNLLLGQYYNDQENNVIKALPYYQRAYELGEEEVEINSNLAWLYWKMGYYEMTEKYFKRALQLRSECIFIRQLCWLYMFQDKYDLAIHSIDSICSITPCEQSCVVGKFYLYTARREFDQAEKYYDQYLKIGGSSSTLDSMCLAYIYKEQNKDLKASEILYKVHTSIESGQLQNPSAYFWIYWLSVTNALLNEKEESLKYLSEFFNIYKWYSFVDFTLIHPFYENLRDDPEFKAIVKRAQDEKAAIRAQVQEMVDRGEIDL